MPSLMPTGRLLFIFASPHNAQVIPIPIIHSKTAVQHNELKVCQPYQSSLFDFRLRVDLLLHPARWPYLLAEPISI